MTSCYLRGWCKSWSVGCYSGWSLLCGAVPQIKRIGGFQKATRDVSVWLLALTTCLKILCSCRQSEEKAVTHTEVTESHGLTPGSLPVYEEIDDVKGSFSYTQNVLYGTRSTTSRLTSEPVPKLPTSRLTSDPIPKVPSVESCNQNAQNYELIQTADYERMDGTYSVQQCAAYGVSMDKSDDSTMCHDPTMSCDSNVSHDSNQSRDSNTSCDSNSSNRNFDRSCDSNRSCNGSKSSLNSKRSHDSVRSHNSNWSRYTNMSHDSNRLHDSNSSKPHNSERPHGSKSSLDSNESCDSNRSHNFNRSHNSNWSTQDSNTGWIDHTILTVWLQCDNSCESNDCVVTQWQLQHNILYI